MSCKGTHCLVGSGLDVGGGGGGLHCVGVPLALGFDFFALDGVPPPAHT